MSYFYSVGGQMSHLRPRNKAGSCRNWNILFTSTRDFEVFHKTMTDVSVTATFVEFSLFLLDVLPG